MSLTTPICNFGEKSYDFSLQSTENKIINLKDVKGENGYLIMFICNHCPYVKAIINFLVEDTKFLEDTFENMKKFSKKNNFSFPYLYDENQEVAKKYSAICTPDFFGYNKNSELQYRGRILEARKLKPIHKGESELRKAMQLIAKTEKGPEKQFPSMGCSIKWFK